jgi:chorismate-pyruvate lyase
MAGTNDSSWKPANGSPGASVTGPAFTRLQRMLLSTDGTVTHLLEAYADEHVEVAKLVQEVQDSTGAESELDLAGEREKVLRRRVLLRGRRTGRTLLYAEAVVVLSRVEPPFLDGLVGTDKPIGLLLAELRTETFREILRVGREPSGPAGAHFGLDPTAELVSRTYRIISRHRPIILITEKFPPHFFRGLPE